MGFACSLHQRTAEILTELNGKGCHGPLAELAAQWIAMRVLNGEVQGRTPQTERACLSALLRVHGDRPVDQLDRATIRTWQAEIGWQKPASRQAKVSTVRRFCRWLVKEGHLVQDPTLEVGRVRVPPTVPRALEPDEVAKVLLSAHDPLDFAAVWVMVGCGLRCVDTSLLDLSDWDQSRQLLHVRGKGGSERVVPVPAEVTDALRLWLTVRGDRPGPLFVTRRGGRISQRRFERMSPAALSRRVGAVMTASGVHAERGDGRSAHSLRHTCASDVLDACHDLRLVQQLLGHRSLATTQRYLRRANLDAMREAMEGRSYVRGPTRMVGLGGAGGPGA